MSDQFIFKGHKMCLIRSIWNGQADKIRFAKNTDHELSSEDGLEMWRIVHVWQETAIDLEIGEFFWKLGYR